MAKPLELYSQYLDGRCLGEREVGELRSWITADARNAREFVEFALLHAAITDRLTLGRLLDDLASRRASGAVTPDMLAEAIRDIEVNSPRVELPPQPPEPEPGEASQFFATLAAVLVVVCLGALAFWQTSRLPAPVPPVAEVAPAPAVAAPAEPEAPTVAARLGASFDAVWKAGRAAASHADLVEGSRFELLSGVAQFNMAGGAAAVVEGPSQFTLTGPDSLELARGKAAVRVAEGGERFLLKTPTMAVVDLGTEFGVQATRSGADRVMVFDGVVALGPPGGDAAAAETPAGGNRLGAGLGVKLSQAESLAEVVRQAAPVENDRYFLRPDEIEIRQRALAGSLEDRLLAAHYQRMRIDGLLAYQGFDYSSSGEEHLVGFLPQPLITAGPVGVSFEQGARPLSDRMTVEGGPVFLMLNTLPDGPFGKAGLLTDDGRIGQTGTELWLTWRARRTKASANDANSAGVSLMFGDRSDVDEPVFFGRAYGELESLVVQSAWGGAPAPAGQRITAAADADASTHQADPMPIDEQEHTWVVRLQFHEGVDRASLWIDPQLAQIDAAPPQAMMDINGIEFDRIRMAVNRQGEVWQFGDFAAALSPEALEELQTVGKYRKDP